MIGRLKRCDPEVEIMNRTIFITFDLNALIWLDAWNLELV
jgi:hypothetical protein